MHLIIKIQVIADGVDETEKKRKKDEPVMVKWSKSWNLSLDGNKITCILRLAHTSTQWPTISTYSFLGIEQS